ncbi:MULTISPECIES: type II secretion system F family protein [unclassified Modestobacter]|uniref:type II secretion system F family protein n=1 Tax=unclassified Modestobacter TaxID=2643866 RepID=UPI0022AA17A4|nr:MULTISPECIES: type II secretion system F family protein [unclassified Modestobacter]MCZ2824681.1 type II secretion system F family protein [Modestobacter sp. VKM Ac-2981]
MPGADTTAPTPKTYEYTVRNSSGRLVKGRIDAVSQSAVGNRLRARGLTPIDVREVKVSGLQREISIPGLGERVELKALAVMARQLSTMIGAGLTLLRSLGVLAEQTENKKLARVLQQVRDDVEKGTALSAAFGAHPEIFPPLMLNMIRAGEIGGFLDQALESLAKNFEAETKLRGKIKSAMTYPIVVFTFAILAVIGMLLFIVPIFEDMFAGFDSALPWPTQFLVVLSEVMTWAAPVLLLVAVAGGLWWRRHKNDSAVRNALDPLKLKLPVFGQLFRKVAVARFSRNFGTMLGAGVPILQALEIVGQTSGNVVIERAVDDVGESVRTGLPLTGPLSNHPVFPPMVVQLMSVGEDTGALDQMMEKIAEFYDAEVEATTEQLTSLIEPLMIAILGALIGSIIVALYLPIFEIFNVMS